MDLNSFRTSVTESLLKRNSKQKQRHVVSQCTRKGEGDHLISYREKQNRCKVCSKNISFECLSCQVCLHPRDCFLSFHFK